MLESGTGAPFLAQGLNDCPENLLCDEELGTCGEGAFPCGSPFGLPLVPPEDLTASGTDTSGDLPVPLQEWITTQLTEGPPCPNGCGSTFQFRDALLFYPLPAEGDEDATPEFDPDTWETAFITFHYGGNPGEKNWVFRYRLQSDMSISGTSFEAVWSSESIQPSDLPSPAKEALLAARTSYLGDEAGEPTLEFGILTAVSWGCSFHHYKYIESKVGSLPLIAVTSAEGLLTVGSPTTE